MNNTNTTTVDCRSGISTLKRPKFGPGMLLQHDDLDMLNLYTRDLSRVMFKSFFGCGVVCGLVAQISKTCGTEVTVGSGMAIACSGDPIWLPREETLRIDKDCTTDPGDELWVVLCGTVKYCSPRTSACPSDDDDSPSGCTREIDGYTIKIVKQLTGCLCGCVEKNNYDPKFTSECKCANPALDCYKSHYEGTCGCDCGKCSGCDCKCVLLARLVRDQQKVWRADHSIRRFIRPVLMRDPQVERENPPSSPPKTGESNEEAEKILTEAKAAIKDARAATREARAAAKRIATSGPLPPTQ